MPNVGHRQAKTVNIEADNPDYSPNHSPSLGNPTHISVSINLRESAITTLGARGMLTPPQVLAASRFRHQWEILNAHDLHSSAWTPPVDRVGTINTTLSDAVLNAGQEMRAVKGLVGRHCFNLLVAVCGLGSSLAEIGKTRRERDTSADLIRLGLDDLAQIWGYTKRRSR